MRYKWDYLFLAFHFCRYSEQLNYKLFSDYFSFVYLSSVIYFVRAPFNCMRCANQDTIFISAMARMLFKVLSPAAILSNLALINYIAHLWSIALIAIVLWLIGVASIAIVVALPLFRRHFKRSRDNNFGYGLDFTWNFPVLYFINYLLIHAVRIYLIRVISCVDSRLHSPLIRSILQLDIFDFYYPTSTSEC